MAYHSHFLTAVATVIVIGVAVSGWTVPDKHRFRRQTIKSLNTPQFPITENSGHYTMFPKKLPLLIHIAGGFGDISCFKNLKPSDKMLDRVKNAAQKCVKTTIMRTDKFIKEMPCDEVASLVKKGFAEINMMNSDGNPMMGTKIDEDAETYQRFPRRIRRQTQNVLQESWKNEAKYQKHLNSEPESEPEVVMQPEFNIEEEFELKEETEIKSKTKTKKSENIAIFQNDAISASEIYDSSEFENDYFIETENDAISESEIDAESHYESDTAEPDMMSDKELDSEFEVKIKSASSEIVPETGPIVSGSSKTKSNSYLEIDKDEAPEFHIEITMDDIKGVDQFSFIREMLDRLLKGEQDVSRFVYVSLSSPSTQGVPIVTGSKLKIHPLKSFILYAMFNKMKDYMQECIASEMDFLDDKNKFDVEKYKTFFAMAFEDKNDEELKVFNKLVDLCDDQTKHVTSNRIEAFSLNCMEPQIEMLCESEELLDPMDIMSESIKKTAKDIKTSKKIADRQRSLSVSDESFENSKEVDVVEKIVDSVEGSDEGSKSDAVSEHLEKLSRDELYKDSSKSDESTEGSVGPSSPESTVSSVDLGTDDSSTVVEESEQTTTPGNVNEETTTMVFEDTEY